MTAPTGVAAVVPVHNPGEGLVDLVNTLASQVDRVVLVDDGSAESAGEILGRCDAAGALVVSHDRNLGIAAALNTGVRQALGAADVDAVLTLDQDSTLPAGFVEALVRTRSAAAVFGLEVGLVAPEHVAGLPDQSRGSHLPGPDAVRLGRDPIQSGTLVTALAVRRVGPFDETLFIDGVDADFALRCLDAGLAVVVAPGLRLGHRLGDRHALGVAGRELSLTRSAPFRYYYLARNRVTLVRRHGRRHPAWAAGQVAGLGGHLALVLTLVPGRGARAREVARGIRDAARGVTGPRP